MGGDSFGGATPPISNFFGDTPTPPIMGMMGIDVDAIGNHSFDRGEQYLRNTLIPLAPFPMISSNVVFPNGQTPAEWSKSVVFNIGGGKKIGFVGFTTVSTPEVVFPGNLGPFEFRPILPTVNAEAARIAKSTDVIVALGHEGATAGTVTNPTGPLIDLADGAVNVDAVIGDHNDLQVNSLRSNGVLVTENRGKGLRFTRMRLVVGTGKDGVVYKTADYHKPWTIGLTPDPAIQAEIDDLTAQLAPILEHTDRLRRPSAIPRSDQCGNGVGRLVRVPRRQCRDGRHARGVRADRRRVRHHQLGRPPGRPDLPGPGHRGRLLPELRSAAVRDHARPVPGPPAVREHRGHARSERSRAQDDARERRLGQRRRKRGAVGAGPLPAGVRPVLHVRRRIFQRRVE